MVLFAFSLQDQVEKYGAYVGIAAFFGLAVLTLLYFAQAREVKRLREWAGRAPERAAELEQAVAEHAEEVRRAPDAGRRRRSRVARAAAAAGRAANGAVKLKPEEVAALAFARAAGVHEPHEPKPHPAPVPAAVGRGRRRRAGRRRRPPRSPPASRPPRRRSRRDQRRRHRRPPPAAAGHARRPARRAAAAAAAPDRAAAAPRPRRRRRGARATRARSCSPRSIGVLVLAGAAFAVTQPARRRRRAAAAPRRRSPRRRRRRGRAPTADAAPTPRDQGRRAGRGLQRHRRDRASPATLRGRSSSSEGYPDDNIERRRRSPRPSSARRRS